MKRILLSVLIILSFNSFSQTNNFSILGRWANGPCSCVEVDGNLALIGNGCNLTILNLDNPAAPEEISHTVLSAMVTGVAVNNNIAYVGTTWGGLGIYVIDYSDPQNPSIIGAYENNYGSCEKIEYKNEFIYFLTPTNGIFIVDVKNPASPEFVKQVSTPDLVDFYVEGDHLYTANKENGMDIYNISDPQNPARVSWIRNDYYINSVVVKDNYAFVGERNNLRVFDVSDASAPQESNSVQANAAIRQSLIIGDTLYGIDGYGSLQIFNINNPTAPQSIANYPWKTLPTQQAISVSNNKLLIAGGTGFFIFDATDLLNLTELESYTTASYFTEMILEEDYLFASDMGLGLFIMDVSDDANPRRISFMTPPDEINFSSVAKKENHVYMASNTGILIIDVSDLNAPVILKKIDYSLVKSLRVQGNYLYVSASNNAKGFTIYDVSNPSDPVEKGSLGLASQAMVVSGNYAYAISNNEDGFNIIDINDPMNPIQKSFSAVNAISYYRSIFVSGNYVYAVGHGLNIIDVSDVLAPTVVGVNWEFSYCSSVKVVNNDAYLGHEDGISAVDISDKTKPVLAHELKSETSLPATTICTNNQKKIYFNQANKGTFILQNDLPTEAKYRSKHSDVTLYQNHPNPFSKETTIEYFLPKAGVVCISVYDVTGKEIAVPENRFRNAGKHSVNWKPHKNSGKEFFYRLLVDNKHVETKKMTAH